MDHRNLEYLFKNDIFKILKNNENKLVPKTTLELSSYLEDTKYSYDMVLKKDAIDIKISVRIRKYKYLLYRHFTIRSRSKYGGKTEIDKLIEGMGQYYFYGWMNKEETEIEEYLLIDISKIRHNLIGNGDHLQNGDGTEFLAFSIRFLDNYNSIIDKNTKLPSRLTNYDHRSILTNQLFMF